MNEICKICSKPVVFVFDKCLLESISVKYFQCVSCGFLQTETPFWLKEAYSQAISDLDTGILQRNITQSHTTFRIIKRSNLIKGKFIDYGGGYGLFVRLMRDKGIDFYYYDKYPINIFAKNYTHIPDTRYDLLTAFEVFEHFENPIDEIKHMFELSDNILFSTILVPKVTLKELSNWWYLSPGSGQHISFYTELSLGKLADQLGAYYLNGKNNMHLFTKSSHSKLYHKRTFLDRMIDHLFSLSVQSRNLP